MEPRDTVDIDRRTVPITKTEQVDHGLADPQRIVGRQALQVVGKQPVQAAVGRLIGEVAAQDRLAQGGVEEVPLRAGTALGHVRAQGPAHAGEGQIVPILAGDLRHEVAQIALPPARATQGDEVDEGLCPRQAVAAFSPVQQFAVDAGNIGRKLCRLGHLHGRHARGATEVGELALGALEFVGFEQVDLLQGQGEPERVAIGWAVVRQSFGQQGIEHPRVEVAVVALTVEALGDGSGLVPRDRRHGQCAATRTPQKGLDCLSRDGGGDQARVGWPELGQPGQVPGTGGWFKLVQCVNEQHDPTAHSSPAEQGGERALDLVGGDQPRLAGVSLSRGPARGMHSPHGRSPSGRLRGAFGEGVGYAEMGGQFGDPTTQHAVYLAGLREDACRMGQQDDSAGSSLRVQGTVDGPEQGALAATGLAGDHQAPGRVRRRRGQSVFEHRSGDRRPFDIAPRAFSYEVGQRTGVRLLPGARGQTQVVGGLGIEVAPQVVRDHGVEFRQSDQGLRRRVPAQDVVADAVRQLTPDAFLEGAQFTRRGGRVLARFLGWKAGRNRGRHAGAVQSAEVEPAPSALIGILQHPVEDLQLRHAAAADLDRRGQSGRMRRGSDALRGRHPAIAVAEQGHDERLRALDLTQANLEHPQLARRLVGLVGILDALAKVDGIQVVTTFAELFRQLRESVSTQVVPFGVHVAEGR